MNNLNSEKADKLAFILVVLFVVTLVIGFIPKAYMIVAPGLDATAFSIQARLISFVYSVLSLSVNVGCAFWLYYEANKCSSVRWVWVALGIFAGVFALILWYLRLIYGHLSTKAT